MIDKLKPTYRAFYVTPYQTVAKAEIDDATILNKINELVDAVNVLIKQGDSRHQTTGAPRKALLATNPHHGAENGLGRLSGLTEEAQIQWLCKIFQVPRSLFR